MDGLQEKGVGGAGRTRDLTKVSQKVRAVGFHWIGFSWGTYR